MLKRYVLAASSAVIACASLVLGAETLPPTVFWSAEPVMPGETAMLQGARWDADTRVILSVPGSRGERTLPLLEVNPRSIRFVIPPDLAANVYPCRLRTAAGETALWLNAPQPWWFQADNGQQATPGGWLRVFGRCLALDPAAARVELRRDGKAAALPVKEATMWSLAATVPKEFAAGSYEVRVHNGRGGDTAWAQAGTVTVSAPVAPWKETVFAVNDLGATPDDDTDDSAAFAQALEAAAKNGGGIVRFGPGRYRLKGGFTLPPHVLIEGAGEELTHLSWADTDEPPPALLDAASDLGIQDLSLYAFNYRTGLRVNEKPVANAHNVFIRRVRARFTALSLKGLKPETAMKRRVALDRAAVFRIFADNVQITDCDLAFTTGIGFSPQGRDVVCIGNRVWAEAGGWCAVGGGRRAIVEQNAFEGCTTGITRGAEVWFAHNRVAHQYAGFREGFTTDGSFGGPGLIQIGRIEGNRMTLAAAARGRTEPPHIPAAVRILAGAGEGQYRHIVSFDGKTLVMDRPWDVAPDANSVFWAANEMGRHILFDNDSTDTGIAAQLYGGALDCVVAGNRSARSGGFRVWANNIGWYVQVLGNTIAEGYGTEGPELAGGTSAIHVIGPYVREFKGTTARGVVIRGNRLTNHATITLRAAIHDVLVENNVLCDSPRGIVGDLWQRQQGVLLRGNRFERVGQPVAPPEAAAWYRTIASP